MIDLSRLNTFLLVERFKVETPESIRASLIPGEWVLSIDLSNTSLHIPIHPNSRKYLRFLPRFSSVPVHLPPFQPGHGPSSLYNDCKVSEADGSDKGSQTLPIPGRLADQGPVPGGTTEHSDMVDLTQSLGWMINQEKLELKPTKVLSFMGYKYHLDSTLVKSTQDRWLKLQDLILRLK